MQADNTLFETILPIIIESGYTYGGSRIKIHLQNDATYVQSLPSRQRITRVMKSRGIVVVNDPRKPRIDHTPVAGDNVCPNLLQRDFTTTQINQKWVTDITYIYTKSQRWTFLASVIDLHTMQVIGWKYAVRMTTNLVQRALQDAITRQGNPKDVIVHSDRGSQYTSEQYRSFAAKHNLRLSYSRKGNPYDNAVIESFHATLKKECVYRTQFQTFELAKHTLFKYIEGWYNSRRIQVKLGMSPNQFAAAIA